MRRILMASCILYPILLFTVSAQDIESRLSGNSAGSGFTILDNSNADLFTVRGTGHTGIGTNNPQFRLSLATDGGILAQGVLNSGVSLPNTTNAVLIWYPRKAAFRAGISESSTWYDANTGEASFASGSGTKASGNYSVAMGLESIANGNISTALGNNSTASGLYATAMGSWTIASGSCATAFGNLTTASNYASTAMGWESTASGDRSTAIGLTATASGDRSIAIGSYISTNGKRGAMYLGDASSTTVRNAYADNHFYAVFDHGFSLFTDASAGNTYCVYLLNHSTSWLSCSDSTKKTNYQSADGEAVLDRFSRLRLGSWNFVDHDPVRERHYGPMAQEWFSAFGRDGLGVIGNDTSLASADVDGIAYIAIQALEKRTSELREKTKEVLELRRQLSTLREEKAAEVEELRGLLSEMREEMQVLRRDIARLYVRQQSDSPHIVQTDLGRP